MPLPDATVLRIKAATRDLIDACGGPARAAAIAGVAETTLSRWKLPHHGEVVPVMAALALEADCGLPAVTAAMAAIHGRGLADPEGGGAPAVSVMSRVAELTREQGELMTAFGEAMADGRVTAAEAERTDREAADVERSVARLRQDLAAIKAPRVVRGGAA